MPTFQGLVSEEQLNALVAYVKSLAPPSAPGQRTASAATQAVPAPVPAKGSQVE
jgi:mono/diheme cytochrome c family protein